MRYIRVEYILKPEAPLEEVKSVISDFVAAISAQYPQHRYSSYQTSSDPRQFVHIGELAEGAMDSLTSQSFFQHFSAYLRSQCVNAPTATPLLRVAATSAEGPGGKHIASAKGAHNDHA